MIDFIRILNDGKKLYRVSIIEDEVVKEVDAITRKYTDAVEKERSELRSDTISSDHEENLDGGLLTRYVAKWDAYLRMKLRFCLVSHDVVYANDDEPERPVRRYAFAFKNDFDGSILPAVETFIHNFLVTGVLYDWYRSMNLPIADTYQAEADELLEKIVSMLRGKPSTTRPLQPFGPPYPTTPLF